MTPTPTRKSVVTAYRINWSHKSDPKKVYKSKNLFTSTRVKEIYIRAIFNFTNATHWIEEVELKHDHTMTIIESAHEGF